MQNDANTLTVGQSDFVDLDRTLREITAGERLTDELDLQARMGTGVSMTWAELCHEIAQSDASGRLFRQHPVSHSGVSGQLRIVAA